MKKNEKKGERIVEKLTLTETEELERRQGINQTIHCGLMQEGTALQGRILIQKKQSLSLLQFCLYAKPLIYFPKAIQ